MAPQTRASSRQATSRTMRMSLFPRPTDPYKNGDYTLAKKVMRSDGMLYEIYFWYWWIAKHLYHPERLERNKRATKWDPDLLRGTTLPQIGVRTDESRRQGLRYIAKFWNWLFGKEARACFEVMLTAQGLLLVSNTKSAGRLRRALIGFATPVDSVNARHFSNSVILHKGQDGLVWGPLSLLNHHCTKSHFVISSCVKVPQESKVKAIWKVRLNGHPFREPVIGEQVWLEYVGEDGKLPFKCLCSAKDGQHREYFIQNDDDTMDSGSER